MVSCRRDSDFFQGLSEMHSDHFGRNGVELSRAVLGLSDGNEVRHDKIHRMSFESVSSAADLPSLGGLGLPTYLSFAHLTQLRRNEFGKLPHAEFKKLGAGSTTSRCAGPVFATAKSLEPGFSIGFCRAIEIEVIVESS
jgi:hypothetical protein